MSESEIELEGKDVNLNEEELLNSDVETTSRSVPDAGCNSQDVLAMLTEMTKTLKTIDHRSRANQAAIKANLKRPKANSSPIPRPSKKARDTSLHDEEGEEEEEEEEDDIEAMFGDSPSQDGPQVDEDQWMDALDDDQGEDTFGPAVTNHLAKMANSRFGKLQGNSRIKEKQAAYPVPANCQGVVTPRVNGEVYHRLSLRANKPMKFRDARMSNIQRSLVGGAAAVIQMLESCTVASRPGAKPLDAKALFKTGLDALTFLGHANYELSLRRRESMKGCLKAELANALCSQELPVTKFLFGDDFQQALKHAKQVAQMGREAGKKDQNWPKNGWKPKKHWQGSKNGYNHKNKRAEK